VPWLGTLCPTPTDHEPWWDAAARLGSPRGRIWGQITSTAARGWEAMTGKPYSYFTEPAVQKGSLACLGAGRKPTSQGWDRSCPISLRTPILSAPHEPVQLSPTPAEAGRGIWGCSSLCITALLPSWSSGLPRQWRHRPPPATNPICAGRGRREKVLCKEPWGGKGLSALRKVGKTLGACGRGQDDSLCATQTTLRIPRFSQIIPKRLLWSLPRHHMLPGQLSGSHNDAKRARRHKAGAKGSRFRGAALGEAWTLQYPP